MSEGTDRFRADVVESDIYQADDQPASALESTILIVVDEDKKTKRATNRREKLHIDSIHSCYKSLF